MLSMDNIQEVFTSNKGQVFPVYVTSTGKTVVFREYGWHSLSVRPDDGYSQSEVNEIWKEWSLYWNGV